MDSDDSQFTSLQKVLSVTYYVKRFVENLKVISGNKERTFNGEVSAEENVNSTDFFKRIFKNRTLFTLALVY